MQPVQKPTKRAHSKLEPQAEANLNDQLGNLPNACEHAAAGFALLNEEGRFRWANGAFYQLLGYLREELTDRPWQELIFAADRSAHQTRWEELRAGRVPFFHGDVRWLHKSGEVIWTAETASLLGKPDGNVSDVLLQVQGLNVRKQAEQSQRRDHNFAESLIQLAQAVILVLDPQQRILRVNPFTVEISGLRADEVEGTDWCLSLLPEDCRDEGRELFRAAAAGKGVRNVRCPLLSKDRGRHEIEWSARALTDDGGQLTAVLLIGHDITELKQAQAKLLETERLAAIGQLASGIAHESRNALQQIGACAEMLTMELQQLPEALDLVQGIHEAEARLYRLFEDIRAYAVRLQLDRRHQEISGLWRNAWAIVLSNYPHRELRLTEQHSGDDLNLPVSSGYLEQAFLKVFENAAEATPGPVEVRIRCRAVRLHGRPALEITMYNSGPPFTAEALKQAFEPFFTTKTQGIGLGLPVVKRIVAAHGGQVSVSNPTEGGAEVQIVLPREA